jgi:Fe-Mn family superoxide dismutase
MGEKNFYTLPELPYAPDALLPQMSAGQLTIHHAKHHNAYVTGANALFAKLDEVKNGAAAADEKALAKALSFQIGGHVLHSLFWRNLAPSAKAQKEPTRELVQAITDNFGSLDSFRKRFTDLAMSIEGSGWAALSK